MGRFTTIPVLKAFKVFYGENTFFFEPYKSLYTVLELYIFLSYLNICLLIKYLDLTFISRTAGYCNIVTIVYTFTISNT